VGERWLELMRGKMGDRRGTEGLMGGRRIDGRPWKTHGNSEEV
jgi:hypothetical protein